MLFAQSSLKEFCGRVQGLRPVLMEKEPVDLVGEHELFHLDLPPTELLDQGDGLTEGDIPVIVAVDHQYR